MIQFMLSLWQDTPDLEPIPGVEPYSSEEWRSLDYWGEWLLGHEDAVLDAWFNMKNFTCCQMGVGMWFKPTPDAEWYQAMDHFWHLEGWFAALNHILTSEDSEFRTFVWDESSLTMRRHGDLLTLYDGHPEADRYALRPVTIPLRPFADHLIREGQISVRLMTTLLDRLLSRGYDPAALTAHITPLGDKPYPAPDDHFLKAAIIYRELHQPHYFAQVAEAAERLSGLGLD